MEPEDNLLIYVALLMALILVNAFFSMSEIAIISLNDNKIRKMAQEGNKKAAAVVKLINEPSRFLATIQLGVTVSGFLAAAVAADTFAARLAASMRGVPVNPTAIRVIALICITLALSVISLVLGTLVPKRVGMHHFEKIAFGVAEPLLFISRVARPMVALLATSTNAMLRLLGIDPAQKTEQVTEEEIRMMIDVGNESGNIAEAEKDMLNNIFEFDDRTAVEMMTHRTEVVAMEVGAPLPEIIETAVSTGYSRIPVYENDMDSIIGILYVKDLLARVLNSPGEPFDLNSYLREPMYVLESANCKKLLAELQQKKMQMAIVVDEYGGTSGVVTMEDLLEFIVGNIQDEYDDDEEEEIAAIGDNLYEIDGQTGMEEIEKFFQIQLDEDEEGDFETIGGYIIHCLGYIPAEGERAAVEVDNVSFTVSQVDERRIIKLRAQVSPPEPVEASSKKKEKRE